LLPGCCFTPRPGREANSIDSFCIGYLGNTMITIYHLGVSQSDRIVWLMEELGLPYRLEWFDRGPDRLAPPEYVALHPAAMAPVIRDGEQLLAESTAIVQYIAHRYGGGRLTVAPASPHYADYLYWLQFNNNALNGVFVQSALANSGHDGGLIGKVANRRTEGLYQHMNQHLANKTHLAGEEFTLADLMSGFALITMPQLGMGRTLDDLPNVQRYAHRLTQRAAWQKAMSIAGPQARRPPV
jgi:glutathione S-transferase